MQTEFEAKFLNIDKDEIRSKLKSLGGTLVHPEELHTAAYFDLPEEKKSKDAFLRVRQENNKTTLSLKIIDGDEIQNQKELSLQIDNMQNAMELLASIGCNQKAYKAKKREEWMLDTTQITIDEWPFLEPFIEIEAASEKEVESIAQKLGFDYSQAIFGAVGKLYIMKYGIYSDAIDRIGVLNFEMKNPFLKNNRE